MKLILIICLSTYWLFASINNFFDIDIKKAVESIGQEAVVNTKENRTITIINPENKLQRKVQRDNSILIEYIGYLKTNKKAYGLIAFENNKLVITNNEVININGEKFIVNSLDIKNIVLKSKKNSKERVIYFSYKK